MIKGTKIMYAILTAIVTSGVYSTVALGAPTEIYGYKKMNLIEYHQSNYDKMGNLIYVPDETTFSTGDKIEGFTYSTKKTNKHSATILNGRKKVDAVSHATTGGSSSEKLDGVGSATGGYVGADVVFDFDMLANASILSDLGYKTKDVENYLNVFNTTTRTHIGKKSEGDFLVSYEDYIAKASEAINDDSYLSFEDYLSTNDCKKQSPLYHVKYVLANGTFGEQMFGSEVSKKNSPIVNVDLQNNVKGNTIKLTFDKNNSWADDITSIVLMKNGLEFKLDENVKIDKKNGEININSNVLEYGSNKILIKAKSYRTVTLNQSLYKGKVNLISNKNQKVGEDLIISGGNKEYVKSIREININGTIIDKSLLKIDDSNNIILDKKNFNQIGSYSIILKSEPNFKDVRLNLVVSREDINEIKLHEDNINNTDGNTLSIFVENYSNDWRNSIDKIIIGKYQYKLDEVQINNNEIILTPEILKGQNGEVEIKIILKDKKEYKVNQHIYAAGKVLKAPKLNGGKFELGQDMTIDFECDKKFQNSINKIEQIDSFGIAPLNYKLEYTVQNGRIIVKYDSKKFSKNEVYTLRVFAEGYEPEDVKVELAKKAPIMLLPNMPKSESEFAIQISREAKDFYWGDKVKHVYVDNIRLKKDIDYTISIDGVQFKSSVIKNSGEHRIKICSEGYIDYEKTLKFVNKDGELEDKKDVNIKIEKDLKIGQDLVINSDDKEFIKGIYEINVNGNIIKHNLYTKGDNLIINQSVFNSLGENTINIKSLNYNKISMNVSIIQDESFKIAPTINSDNKDNILSKEIELTFNDNKEWREGIEALLVNGKELNNNSYTILNGKIIINPGVLNEGKQTISICSKGFNNTSIIQEIGKGLPSEISLMTSKINSGDKLKIYYVYTDRYNVEEIYINDKKVDMIKQTEKSVPGDIYLSGELFNEPGEYTIKLKCNGFVDKYFKLNVQAKKLPMPEYDSSTGLKNVSQNVKLDRETINVGDKATIYYEYQSEYKPNKILVNGKEIDMNKDYNFNFIGYGTIDEKVFNKAGEYKITLKADGYKDKELKISVLDKSIQKPVENTGGESSGDSNMLKEVPEEVKVIGESINLGQKLKIYSAFGRDYNVNSVEVNGEKLDLKKDCEDPGIFFDMYIKEHVFNNIGQYIIILKADGYKDKEIKINVKHKNIEKPVENNEFKNVPQNVKLDRETINVGDKATIYYEYQSEYKPNKILVNGKEIDMNKDYNFNFIGYGTIDEKVFNKAGEYKITLKADGYKDKELKISVLDKSIQKPVENTGGESSGDSNMLKEVPEEVKVIGESINLGQKLKIYSAFGRDYNVNSVEVNGEKLDLKKDCEDPGIFFDMYIKEHVFKKEGEYKIILKADGYKDKQIKINVKHKNDLNTSKEESGLKNVPSSVKLSNEVIKKGTNPNIYYGYKLEYKPDKILVNGKEIDMVKDYEFAFIGNGTIKNICNEKGEYSIILKSTGYKDLELKLNIV